MAKKKIKNNDSSKLNCKIDKKSHISENKNENKNNNNEQNSLNYNNIPIDYKLDDKLLFILESIILSFKNLMKNNTLIQYKDIVSNYKLYDFSYSSSFNEKLNISKIISNINEIFNEVISKICLLLDRYLKSFLTNDFISTVYSLVNIKNNISPDKNDIENLLQRVVINTKINEITNLDLNSYLKSYVSWYSSLCEYISELKQLGLDINKIDLILVDNINKIIIENLNNEKTNQKSCKLITKNSFYRQCFISIGKYF